MNDHCTYEARFGALFDGDLETEPRAEVEAHLADCAQCAAAWRRYSASIEALRVNPVLPTPTAQVAAIMARVTQAHVSNGFARQSKASVGTPAHAVAAPAMHAAQSPHTVHATRAGHAAREMPIAARLGATMRWHTLATHVTALAAGAMAMLALAPLFGAGGAKSNGPRQALNASAQSPADDTVARASAEQAAAARSESQRALTMALALQQTALARAHVTRDAAEAQAAAESARARAAEATLALAQIANAQRAAALRADLERDALRREDDRLVAAAEQRADARRTDEARAEAQRAAAEAFAAVALVRSFERLGGTLARLDAEFVARLDAADRSETASPPAAQSQRSETPSARDWRAIDIDSASLAATGRRVEHVTIRQEGDRVALSTSGAVDDIVEALLARLDDPDPAVRAAVELRLDDIAAELGVARAGGVRSRKSADEPWWRSDRGQVAALTIDNTEDTREPWPAWWSRARPTVGR